ncbi:diguanylate cyclase [Brevundimonas diminuta]|uniref:diguanylate cyclase n=1 Tax=Brevundimonas diminuta TaxID=293 RepID=A0A1Z3LUN2_BREDI|nr:diguanylate cyclase [Brevundimonas diminuta]ASD25942.1 diguanylate cyclase [Brevundimonas diminuta]
MFQSLTSRIAAVSALVVVALLVLVAALADASRQTRESFRWVTHSAQVIQAMEETVAGLRDAESGQRAYVLTQNAAYAQSFDARISDSLRAFSELVELTRDNPSQQLRLQALGAQLSGRIELMRQPLTLARSGDFARAEALIAEGRGFDSMSAFVLAARELLDEERVVQSRRVEAAERRLARVRGLALIGGPLIAFFSLSVSLMVIRGIRQPVRVITRAMTGLGAGDLNQRIDSRMGSREFDRLARGYNDMADRLATAAKDQSRSERELKRVHEELLASAQTLRERGEVIELLGGMAHRMQAARTDDELAQVIHAFVPRVLPGLPGALYAYNNSRNLLVPLSGWGGHEAETEGFAPDQCWALRRGQSHFVSEPGADVVCGHVSPLAAPYHCEPLLASGEVIGVLHLDGLVEAETQFRLNVLAENIASAMVNQKLQRDLKEQTIRDPLTGLFNRRYMEEALALEVARAARSGAPLCVVMCDVDHFKRFNDEFGHEAGDVVLQAVAAELGHRFRDGDIVCRYGGEEFIVIAPGTKAETLAPRVETVRQAIAAIALRLGKQPLGSSTMSFGVAEWSKGMNRDGDALVQAADAALYRAKKEGRNRVVLHVEETA